MTRAHRSRLARVALLVVFGLCAWFAHDFAARALVDQGVAGALFSGGASWASALAALAFVASRLLGCLVFASIPAIVVARLPIKGPAHAADDERPA